VRPLLRGRLWLKNQVYSINLVYHHCSYQFINQSTIRMENQPHYRVLLAEDNLFNQKIAVTMLKKLGITTDVANNGLEVLEKLSNTNYALILMDCQMPKMDGYEATTKIRTHEKTSGQHLPIVAMTAHSSPQEREYCFNVGMDDYIAKPFKIDDLRTVFSRWKLI